MGTAGRASLKKFPCIDYICLGEADEFFADVCRKILNGEKDFPLPYGLLRHGEAIPKVLPHRITMDMNKAPIVDADDFFAALKENFTDEEIKLIAPVLMTEGSIGCWCGEKHSCTFCGLNGIIKTYRAKTPERIADELEYLTGRYGNQTIFFSDNIMSREAEIELPELLRGRKEKMHLFTEIKSNLHDSDVKALSEAGFSSFSPASKV